MNKGVDNDRLRLMIAKCRWTFAKTMPFAPHEYIVKDKCPLTKEEFEYFVEMQRQYGVRERWGKYNNPYLYIDDYKYWTMGAPLEDTTVINRAKACVVDDIHQLHEGITNIKHEGDMNATTPIDEYVSRKLCLKTDDKAFNIELLNGRLKEISDCAKHLERIRNNYICEIMHQWSALISVDYPLYNKVEDIHPGDTIFTGISLPFDNIPDAIAVRIQMEKRSLYYGVTYMPVTKERREEMQEALGYINKNGDFIKGSDWLYYKFASYKEVYEKFKVLIGIIG